MERTIAAALLLMLASCSMPLSTPLQKVERSPTYQVGFGDGCATASAEGAGLPQEPRRSAALFDRDPDYRAGWLSGHAQCRPPRAASMFIGPN